MRPILVVDVGNTNTRFGVHSGSGVENVRVVPTSEFSLDLLPDGDLPLAVASVVSEKTALLKESGAFLVTAERVEKEIDFSLVDATTLGGDRIANVMALAKYANLPAICVGCGTAITFEVLDANRVFRGGCIAPGRALMRKALNAKTSKLPLVSDFHGKKPPALGMDTVSAISAGCDVGALGIVEGVVSALENEMGGCVSQVIAAGGDAEFFADSILRISYGGGDFTLKGIAEIWRINHEDVAT